MPQPPPSALPWPKNSEAEESSQPDEGRGKQRPYEETTA